MKIYYELVTLGELNDDNTNSYCKIEGYDSDSIDGIIKNREEYVKSHPDVEVYYRKAYKPTSAKNIWHGGVLTDGNDIVKEFFLVSIDSYRYRVRRVHKLLKRDVKFNTMTNKLLAIRKKILNRVAFWRKLETYRVVRGFLRIWLPFYDFVDDHVLYYISKWYGDFAYWFKRMRYFNKYHHDIQESWSLDIHMLDDLRWNVIRLKKESHGIHPQCMIDAITQLHGSDPGFDPNDCYSFRDDASEKLAVTKMHELYDKIVHLIDLYYFYSGEYDDDFVKTPDMQVFHMEHSLNVIDYVKMHDTMQSYWNQIWDIMKEYGQGFWD